MAATERGISVPVPLLYARSVLTTRKNWSELDIFWLFFTLKSSWWVFLSLNFDTICIYFYCALHSFEIKLYYFRSLLCKFLGKKIIAKVCYKIQIMVNLVSCRKKYINICFCCLHLFKSCSHISDTFLIGYEYNNVIALYFVYIIVKKIR